MLDLFQIMDACAGIGPVVAIIKNGLFPIIQIGIPILLILFGTLDLGKAVIGNDDKAIKTATSMLIKRALMALAVFFVVFLVNLVFGWLGKAQTANGTDGPEIKEANWFTCWDEI